MKIRPKNLKSVLLGPLPISRDRALGISERLSATTSLVSSLEHLVQRRHFQKGQLNDWNIMRESHVLSARPTRKLLDAVGGEKATVALHAGRVAASAGLLLPGNSRWRGAANVFLGLSSALLYPRHRYGTDGSDQVACLVQSATGLARMARSTELQDTLLWYVAMQANMSYLVSGWVKVLGRPWRDGSALSGVMRTKTYGHEGFWKLTRKYPVPARFLAHGVLALECLFPLVYAKGGALTKPIIGSAAAFHTANGFVMGLGRFVGGFTSMHPMVAYTSAPKSHPAVSGRDDRLLTAALVTGAGAIAGAAAVAAVRRMRTTDGWPSSERLTTRSGNQLSYDVRRTAGHKRPVVVFVAGLASTVEHFGWITEKIIHESDYGLITYSRAGYGPSRHRGARPYTLQESVDDLVDLVRGAVPEDRDVVLAGHSLGGELVRRAACALGERVRGVVYLDSSHPAELRRSRQQSETAERLRDSLGQFLHSLQGGLGILLSRPEWLDRLPPAYRKRAFAHYADSRMWKAALREWDATDKEFRAFDGPLPAIDAHALVISAQQTVDRDPEHLLMHQDLADAHQGHGKLVRSLIIDGADHDSLLTDARLGARTGERILDFLDEIFQETQPSDDGQANVGLSKPAKGAR